MELGHGEQPHRPRLTQPANGHDAHLLRLCVSLELDALLLTLGAAASAPAGSAPAAAGPGHAPASPLHLDPDVEAGDVEAGEVEAGEVEAGEVEAGEVIEHVIDLTTDPPTRTVRTRADPARAEGPTSGGGNGAGPVIEPPWQRWLREDVEVTRTLAGELLAWGGGLPSSMAPAGSPAATIAVLNRLEAFHRELRDLLGEVEGTPDPSGSDEPPDLSGAPAPPASSAAPSPPAPASHGAAGEGRLARVLRHCRRRLTELDLLRVEVTEQQAAADAPAEPAVGRGLPGEFLG